MFDRQSLVSVTLKIRNKFHSNRLVRFQLVTRYGPQSVASARG